MTTETLWIVIAVVAAVLLIAVAVGLVLLRRRRISLRETDQPDGGSGTAAPPRGGTYRTEGGFDFSSGTATAPGPPPKVPVDPPPAATPAPPAAPADRTGGPGPAAPVDGTGGPGPAAPVDVPTPSTNGSAPTPTAPPPTAPPPTAPPGTGAPPTAPPVPPPAAPPPAAPPAATPPTTTAPRGTPPVDEIAPAEGRLERLRGRLARSRSGFGQGLLGLLGAGELDEESWEDVEATLLQADLGPETTVGDRRDAAHRAGPPGRPHPRPGPAAAARRAHRGAAPRAGPLGARAAARAAARAVLLVVGVNGTGKTTTTGKLARVLVAGGRHVVLGAADTFRAAAAEQLTTWGERAGATVVRGPEGADPASVAFDAVKQGAEEGADVVLLDTAGRLHTKTGLMDELGKVKRVVERQAEVDEVLLVLDATTGQNGLTQARVFGDVVKVTGIVLTKLDGTAKGGIVFRVQRELGVPVKLVGLGEGRRRPGAVRAGRVRRRPAGLSLTANRRRGNPSVTWTRASRSRMCNTARRSRKHARSEYSSQPGRQQEGNRAQFRRYRVGARERSARDAHDPRSGVLLRRHGP